MKLAALSWFAVFCAAWYLWVPVTFWFGRVFCRYCCPLGLCQSLVNLLFRPKSHVRRVCVALPRTRLQRAVNWALVVAYFALPVGMFLNPWGVFGRVLVGFVPGMVFFGAVLATAAVGKGRFWCNWICPFGTLFELTARLGWHRDTPCRSCRNCRACFPKDAPDAARDRDAPPARAEGLSRRETLRGVALLAAAEIAEKTTDGGLAGVTLPGVPARKEPVLPPGASPRFRNLCVGCGLCVKACPSGCLRQSVSWTRFGQVELDFRNGYCRTACDYRCAQLCPTLALTPLRTVARTKVRLGTAVWRRDLCLRSTKGENCSACVRKCPLQAVRLVAGFPVVEADACIGCGACEHVCPTRPLPAIVVEVRREDDLADEMRALLTDGGFSVVAARNGAIAGRETGRGIAPLLKLCDEGALKGALVMDKVIGRAAAAICTVGGAAEVRTPMASEAAVAFLERHGIPCRADRTVPRILNRDRSGECPMECAVRDLEEPVDMVNVLRKAIKR